MKEKWLSILDTLDYAFQPIIHCHTGKIYAVEALLRNVDQLDDINNINQLFDNAFNEDILYEFDLLLREKAIKKFTQIDMENLKLFYNLDNRIIYNKNYTQGNTSKILEKYELDKSLICFELSEKGSVVEQKALSSMIENYKKSDYCIAIDDFGTGVSGLKLLYYSEADVIKLDRFFITDINTDTKKKHFCSSIIDMAHIMGIKVVAEGVETVNEYYTCYEIGVDFIQGFLVQKAQIDINNIQKKYSNISDILKNNKRVNSASLIDKKYIDTIEALEETSSLDELFLHFKEKAKNSFIPIVNEHSNLLGVIYEKDIKKISYSQYGLSLAKNQNIRTTLKKYIQAVLSVEITWGIDKTLEMFNLNKTNDLGIFITRANKYQGYVNLNSLLTLSYNRNLEIASNQNPLTKLPGNQQIDLVLNETFVKKELSHIIYFDFNNFKPFNDYYGFRQGDRAILIFSELLQKKYPKEAFIAHIGGDDFFVCINSLIFENIYELTDDICTEFKLSVQNLYTQEDKNRGYILSKDRFNHERKFDLLSVSTAIIEVNKYSNIENFDYIISILKKASKETSKPLGVSL